MTITRSILMLAAALLGAAAARAAGIAVSQHNLSISGTGNFTATAGGNVAGSSEICIFCHTPHTASQQGALWNRFDSGVVYTPYTSTTLKAKVGQPTGASKMCLSCHDGTVALGKVRSRSAPIAMKSSAASLAGSANNLGTDLSDDHPISFKYDAALTAANGQLQSPPKSGHVRLDGNGELQCTACHDPHNNQNPGFLVMNNAGSALCLTCHKVNFWSQSSHATSAKTWNGLAPNPWTHSREITVAGNACESCHDPHGAGGKQRLLNFAAEEQNCFTCHNGNVAVKNVQADFAKASVHPVIDTTGVHDPLENDLVAVGVNRHVECADCHNAHAVNSTPGTSPGLASGALAGVRGLTSTGARVSQVTYEHETCFRCHGDTAKGPARVNRQYPQLNTRLEFQDLGGTNSFHPVVSVGRNPSVPSLRPPWTTASKISCGDCHNSDTSVAAGGTGPNGPHGSIYPPLLERSLSLSDSAATTGNSALCFKCHNFSDNAWPRHTQHIAMTSCMTCHDPHASPNSRLINFDPGIVTGARAFQAMGLNHGTCTMTCHGANHINLSY